MIDAPNKPFHEEDENITDRDLSRLARQEGESKRDPDKRPAEDKPPVGEPGGEMPLILGSGQGKKPPEAA